MIQQKKHGEYFLQTYAATITANTSIFRFANTTTSNMWITELRIQQSVPNNAAATFNIVVLSPDQATTISTTELALPASTRFRRIDLTYSPIRVRPGEVINVLAPATLQSPSPANVIISLKIT